MPVVLSTGRSWHGTKALFEELGLPAGPTVCSNGAVIVRYPPQEIIKAITFDPRPVITQVEEFAPGSLIAVEEIGRGYRLNDRFPGDDLTGELIIEDAEQLSSRPVTRVIVRDPTRSEGDFVALADTSACTVSPTSSGWSAWLDIAPDGVNKATALAEVAAGFGVSAEDVLAFGDGRNDIEMLRWAGRGVAMGDAPDEVKTAADAVTGPSTRTDWHRITSLVLGMRSRRGSEDLSSSTTVRRSTSSPRLRSSRTELSRDIAPSRADFVRRPDCDPVRHDPRGPDPERRDPRDRDPEVATRRRHREPRRSLAWGACRRRLSGPMTSGRYGPPWAMSSSTSVRSVAVRSRSSAETDSSRFASARASWACGCHSVRLGRSFVGRAPRPAPSPLA